MQTTIQLLIRFAGIGQITLVFGSLAIPKILNWKGELAKVQPLIRQIFWTYAAYILGTNLCFGLLSAFDPNDLVNGSTLAICVTGFITVYWISRVLIQFFGFGRENFPKGKWNRVGEVVLVALFIFLSVTYCLAFYINCTHV